jgi:amino acid adenylation domain-containing protein
MISATPINLDSPRGQATGSLATEFEANSRTDPQKIALTCGAENLTYSELNAAANRLANHLLSLDLPRNSIVALWLDRTNEAVVAMLGVLKAGHAYLPLDATYPAARIAETLEDASPAALISTPELAASLPCIGTHLITLDETLSAENSNPDVAIGPSDAAYVMYTSGSTGRPKGVLIPNSAAIGLFHSTGARFQFNQDDTWTWFHSPAFDFSVWEIWGALLSGARLVVVPFETTRNPEEFYRLLSTERVTVLNQTPAGFHLLDQVEERGSMWPLAVRLLILGGEALKFSSLRGWFQRHPGVRIVNAYGLTETTVIATMRDIEEHEVLSDSEAHSPIGQAISTIHVQVLDDDGIPVAGDQQGELWIGGPGLALGYLNRPELTAERFLDDPAAPGVKLYRTGDLVSRRPDGDLVYFGRRDEQVKIKGFRIELGEVEAALVRCPGVAQACVVTHPALDGAAQLAAYFVATEKDPASPQALAKHLAHQLPPQMLPASYTRLAAFPQTSSGKIDRKALPEPSFDAGDGVSSSREHCSEVEEAVLALVRNAVGIQSIGIEDNFFAIGGHSLLGTQFALRAREAFGVKVSLRDIFETDTIAELAERIESRVLEEIESLPEAEVYRLAGNLPGGCAA